MHLQPPRREATVCLLVCLAAASLLVGLDTSRARAAPPPSGGCDAWLLPVDGPVARSFEAPAFAYGPGHRGIDFAVPPGTPVARVRRRRGRVRRPGRRLPARRRRPRRQPPHDVRVPGRHQRARRRTRPADRSSAAPAAPAPSTRPAASISASASATATSIRSASSVCAISPDWSGSSLPTTCRPSHGTPGAWSQGRSPRVDRVSQRSPAISPVRSAMLPVRPSTPGAAVGTP